MRSFTSMANWSTLITQRGNFAFIDDDNYVLFQKIQIFSQVAITYEIDKSEIARKFFSRHESHFSSQDTIS